ncbi:hypothetical protein J6590_025479 [Homalodisca vitripennis]|nr:hypothetical protein J6590_025479 [Homalodisca vitripennis]
MFVNPLHGLPLLVHHCTDSIKSLPGEDDKERKRPRPTRHESETCLQESQLTCLSVFLTGSDQNVKQHFPRRVEADPLFSLILPVLTDPLPMQTEFEPAISLTHIPSPTSSARRSLRPDQPSPVRPGYFRMSIYKKIKWTPAHCNQPGPDRTGWAEPGQ